MRYSKHLIWSAGKAKFDEKQVRLKKDLKPIARSGRGKKASRSLVLDKGFSVVDFLL